MIKITAGKYEFSAKLEEKKAPKTCEAFRKMLRTPTNSTIVVGVVKQSGLLLRNKLISKMKIIRPIRLKERFSFIQEVL